MTIICLLFIYASVLPWVSFVSQTIDSKFGPVTFKIKAQKNPYQNFLEKLYRDAPSRVNQDYGDPLLLTPYIEEGNFEEAKSLAAVDLKGIIEGVQSYAGYLTVDVTHGGHLWFWYFPVKNKEANTAPLIMWLQGGPGVSSLFGLFYEIGPFFIANSAHGSKITERQFSWSNDHSLLFIDSPVRTGYSFIDDLNGLAKDQETVGKHLYLALRQFLILFEELRSVPLFIASQGYAAKSAASLAMEIYKHRISDHKINLEGLAIGNGMIDPICLFGYSEFAKQIGLVDSAMADFMLSIELVGKLSMKSHEPEKAYQHWNIILELLRNASNFDNFYNYAANSFPFDGKLRNIIQHTSMRRALHVGNTTFASVELVFSHLEADFMNSAAPLIVELLKHYRIMFYSGQLDIIMAYPLLVDMFESLYWPGNQEYIRKERLPLIYEGNLVGYYKSVGNFLEVMVRNAGHMVAADQPELALKLISAFVQNENLMDDFDAPN